MDQTNFPDKEQLAVINDRSDRLKVVAGPGAGKTSTLVEKLIRLINRNKPENERVDPKRVLFITFTRNSAEDIKRKLGKELEKGKPRISLEDLNDLYVSTFHGFCNILREEYKEDFLDYKDAEILNEEKNFVKIYDNLYGIKDYKETHDDDKEIDSELKEIWKGEPEGDKIEDYGPHSNKNPGIRDILKGLSVIQENYRYIFKEVKKKFTDSEVEVIGYYLEYYGALRRDKLQVDFGMLIRIVVEKLRKDNDFREKIQNKYDYIFVDEFQDTNKLQGELLNRIEGPAKMVVVGDDWQSIYGFRGSDKEIFDNFKTDNELKLSTNYRSRKNLVAFANKVSKREDPIESSSKEEGNKVIIKEFNDAEQENKGILEFIEGLNKNNNRKISYSDIAILTTSLRSTNKKENPILKLINLLKNKGINLKVNGEGNLRNQDYISEIIRLFEYISDKRGMIKKPEIKFLLLKFIPEIYKEAHLEKEGSVLELLYQILKDSKFFVDSVKKRKINILKNIGILTKIIKDYEEQSEVPTLNNFIKYFDFRANYFDEAEDADNNAINLMTLHKAKGLEFKVVIIPYVNKRRYPGSKTNRFENLMPKFNPKEENLRAFYVGITRAKELLHISYNKTASEYINLLYNDKSTNFIKDKGSTLSRFLGKDKKEEINISGIQDSTEDNNFNVLSVGKIIEFLNCPLKYDIKFDYGMKVPVQRYYGFGLYMHKLLKDYNWHRKLNRKVKIDELIFQDDIPKPGKKETVEKQFKQYVSNYDSDLNNVIDLEKAFKFTFSQNMQIVGRADLILKRDKDIVVVDFKSGNKDEEKLRIAKIQIILYALCLPEYKINRGEVYFLKDGKSESFFISEKDKEEIKCSLKEIENYLESGKVLYNNNPKKANYHCSSCELNKICPFSKVEEKDREKDKDYELNVLLESEPNYNL